ncbi:pentapeptide repeat-containing protein [Isoptericola jiangsuensis]|uniref:pentapeptide repeat-containing protein n=1 Tax=Isoptericola jiangsuensis TaxID=548579 RepID=UPI003AADDCC1
MATHRTTAPVVDAVVLENLTDADAADLVAGAELDGVRHADVDTDHLVLRGARIDESRLDGLRAPEADLRQLRLTEVVMARVDVPVVQGVRGRWHGVELRDARIGSAELYESVWESVRLVGCKLGFVNLRGARLRDVIFQDCTVDELDLVQATATRVSFEDCRIGRLDVQASTLQDVDLRGAELAGVAGTDALRGTVVSSTQLADLAPLLAANLGITVTD